MSEMTTEQKNSLISKIAPQRDTDPKESHGGKREKSGRKKMDNDKKRQFVIVSATIPVKEIDYFSEFLNDGKSRSKTILTAIRFYIEHLKQVSKQNNVVIITATQEESLAIQNATEAIEEEKVQELKSDVSITEPTIPTESYI